MVYGARMNKKQKTFLIATLVVAVSLTQADALKAALDMQHLSRINI